MKRIASFEVNHDKLKPGMYTSRIDGDKSAAANHTGFPDDYTTGRKTFNPLAGKWLLTVTEEPRWRKG